MKKSGNPEKKTRKNGIPAIASPAHLVPVLQDLGLARGRLSLHVLIVGRQPVHAVVLVPLDVLDHRRVRRLH